MALSRFGGAPPEWPSAGRGLGTQPAGFSAGCRALMMMVNDVLHRKLSSFAGLKYLCYYELFHCSLLHVAGYMLFAV